MQHLVAKPSKKGEIRGVPFWGLNTRFSGMYENAFYKNDIPSLMTLFTGIPTFPENAFSDIWRPKSDTRSWHFRVGGGIPEYLPTIAPNLAKPEIFCVNFGVVFWGENDEVRFWGVRGFGS